MEKVILKESKAKMIDYDKKHDILSVHNGFAKNEKFYGNLDIGDLILDISTRGRVRGIEIINASRFLSDWDISKDILGNLTNASFNAMVKPTSITISLSFMAKNLKQEIPAKIAVPVSLRQTGN